MMLLKQMVTSLINKRRLGWLAGACVSGIVVLLSAGAHAEPQVPFLITVDGQPVAGSKLPAAPATPTEGALDVQIKYDGLGVTPILNVSTVPPRTAYRAGDEIKFLATFNYAAWIERGEVIIYRRGRLSDSKIYRRIPIDEDGTAIWTMPADAPAEMSYVLRVYDTEGRFDETVPLPLNRVASDFETHDRGEQATAPGYSEDRTAFRNISVSGGAVTVYGKNVPEDHEVYVAGERVPVDPDGSFVVQRVFPPGLHEVSVTVEKDGEGIDFSRTIEIPETEWFYAGLADFTAGFRWGDHIEEVREGEFGDDFYTRGRLAFYLKGKIKGRYILTAAADTSEKKLKSIFKGLDEKDPRQFLKRIDPDDYYPVYGDDSTFLEDAPTQGKFYVKLAKGPSHAMWGNFKANITGSKFVRTERALYGAQGVYRGNGAAPDGGHKTSLDVHAAIPGTLPHRENFRGTGGSAYFLRFHDITPGSETVTIEVRNSVTGWVIERKTLRHGDDYDIDYVQGVLILRVPLPSTSAVGTENYVVVNYEYTPATDNVDGYVLGGRAQQWFGDHVRAGITGLKEKTQTADQLIYGVDLHIRHSDGTYVEGEFARSEGPGFSTSYSPDGGLTNQLNPSAGIAHRTANAYRAEAHADLTEVTNGLLKGNLEARYEHYERGFSSLDVNAAHWRTLWGVEAEVNVAEKTDLNISYSDEQQGNGTHERQGLGKLRQRFGEHVVVEPFVRHTKRDTGAAAPPTSQQGERTEAGVKLSYEWDEDNIAYVFGQATVQRTGTMYQDDRVGIGGKKRLAEKLSAEGEVSEGTQGLGAAFLLNYEPTSDDRYYIGYTLDPLRDISDSWPFRLIGEDAGTIVAGARRRFNDQWKAYGEDSYDMFGKRRSLTQAYGVTYTPDAAWTISGAAEFGHVFDDTIDPGTGLKNPDFKRKAISVAASYKDDEDGINGFLKGEGRHDDSEDGSRELYAYLLQARVAIQASEDWRAIGSLDVVISDATTTTRDSEYAEGSIGFAYRPTTSDRLNALFKYTYLYDNPGGNQVGIDGTTSSPAQQSHILSADAIYQITPQLSLGAKYGFRIGELKERTVGASWQESQAHLAVLRVDWHVVHNWDALLEGRILWSPTSDQTDMGAVAAIYRHLGENFKIGLGYNFGKFSDDLRDLVHDDQGVFVNMIGKF